MAVISECAPTALSWRQRRDAWLVIGAFAATLLYTALAATPVADGGTGGLLVCPFHALTGLSCFGCGMTRACSRALRGDLAASFGFHPFGIPFLLAFAVVAAHHALRLLRGPHARLPGHDLWEHHGQKALWAAFGLLLIFGLIRFILELEGLRPPL